MKILAVIATVAWIVGLTCLFALSGVQTSALSQPKWAVGDYKYPMDVKGTVRFVTHFQKTVYSVAFPVAVASVVIFALAGLSYDRIQNRRDTERMNESLDRLTKEREW